MVERAPQNIEAKTIIQLNVLKIEGPRPGSEPPFAEIKLGKQTLADVRRQLAVCSLELITAQREVITQGKFSGSLSMPLVEADPQSKKLVGFLICQEEVLSVSSSTKK